MGKDDILSYLFLICAVAGLTFSIFHEWHVSTVMWVLAALVQTIRLMPYA